MNKAKIKIM